MVWYLAGPMSGIPECNYPAFRDACRWLRQHDHIVVSPHEEFPNPDGSIPWVECLRRDMQTLVRCQGIILLPGWAASRGARLELHIALSLEMPVKHLRRISIQELPGHYQLLDFS